MTDADLSGQWAVVTGASKGIGHGIATALVDAGANVVLVARGRGDLEAARVELAGRAVDGQVVRAEVADIAEPESVEGLFAALSEQLPGLNILVANAGSGAVVPFLECTVADWERAMALNLTGTFLCCQAAAHLMLDAPSGTNRSIVAVSSIRAGGVRPGLTAYAVTKAGLNQMVRVAAYELAPHGIRVNALSPGITATPLTLQGNPDVFEQRAKTVPMGRAGTPADMAAAALYLCNPASAFVTGTNLVVDGGESL